MRVVVLGAGAMGSLLGAALAKRHDVTLVGRRPHVDVVNARGLAVEGQTEGVARLRAVARAADAPAPDLILLTTKAYHTRAALSDAVRLLGPDTAVLTLQNGLGNVEAILERVHASRVFAGATTHGVTLVEPGRIRHAGTGYTILGPIDAGRAAEAQRIAAELTACGIEATATDNVDGELWAKVIVNAGINPVAAVTGLANGYLLKVPELTRLLEAASGEGVSVAVALGVRLPQDDLVERTKRVAERTAANKCSMLQDLERGRPTEIDAICGEIVRRGESAGMDVPVNRALRALVKGIEVTTRA